MLAAAARVGDVQAYLAQQLTGRWATSTPRQTPSGLFDLEALTWST